MKRCLQCQTRYESGGACPQCGSVAFMKDGSAEAMEALAREPASDRPGSLGTAPGARESVIWGVAGFVGFFGVGVLSGPMAIIQARKARAIIARDPRYGGEIMARNGLVLGWLSIGVNALLVTMMLLRALH